MRLVSELNAHLQPVPENIRILGPAEAPVPRLKAEYRYQMLIKAAGRKPLNELIQSARQFALKHKWNATALVIDVDPSGHHVERRIFGAASEKIFANPGNVFPV